MSEQEKIAMLEDLLECEEGTLTADVNLDDVDEYDSMAKLSLIVMLQDEFDVDLDSETVKGFKTVGDILEKMVKAE